MAALPVTLNKIHYGQFCFGCIAPDVDKLSATLTQKDTHFFDRTGDYEDMATRRSATFLKRQAEFLSCSFENLSPAKQAFALGYLCHLCVDEVSKHMWRRETWLQFKQVRPGGAFAALDEAAWQRIEDYGAIAEALCSIEVLPVIPAIPMHDLKWMLRGTCAFVRADSVEGEYLALVDLFLQPTPEERRRQQAAFRAQIEPARQQVDLFQIELLIEASLRRSRQRLADLIARRVPEPDYPVLA